jgi:iron complex outermembrane receptor protein
MRKIFSLLLFTIICVSVSAQTPIDSIQKLEEVVVSDSKLKNYSSGYKINTLNDSTLIKNTTSLTGLLAYNSNLYFKENGFGMISSPSFRGTNASQTAVIWNGVNINSQLNGQTDFNTINTINFNSIDIRSGGGSVQYGSGSIGGTIHLNNKLKFNSHFNSSLKASYGSFNTQQYTVSTDFGDTKFSGNIGISFVDSENDYQFLGTDKVNTNGQYNNQNINANFGYFISDKDVLKLYHQTFIGERNLSSTLVAPSRSRYDDTNLRNMLEWTRIGNNIQSTFKVAHLQEHFKYFENKDKANFSFGKVKTLLLKHNLNFKLSNKLRVKSITEYNTIKGEGSSFGDPSRQVFSVTGLLNHRPTERLSYGLNIRKDFTSGFKSPLVFSVDSKFEVSKAYLLKLNASKNYRVPTFNDLYWQPGGNLDLVPESSYQIDFGQEFIFNLFNFKLNAYYITTQDLIQWKPNVSGAWSPINIAETENYGVEAEFQIKKQFNAHHFEAKANYSYTISENKETAKQLIYVPFHKGNASLGYNYNHFSMFYQHLFNGEVFTLSSDSLPFYNVGNIGVAYKLNTQGSINYLLELRVNNIYNSYYENVALRPMPNRNFQIQTTIKF